MYEKAIKVTADGSIHISNVDGISYRPVGRNIRDILDIQKFMRENNVRKIEIDKKAIEHLKVV